MRTELPKIWYIVITIDNKPIIKKWWESKNYGLRVWNVGAHYGYNTIINEPLSKQVRPISGEEITFEEFERLVLNKSTEPQYEVY